MTALELIKKSATILNIKEILDDTSLASVTEANRETVLENNFALTRMFEILKIIIAQLSSDYITIIKECDKTSTNKQIQLSDITDCLKVIQVKYNKIPVSFKITNSAINLNFDGDFVVKYKASINIDYLTDSVNVFYGTISEESLIYGLISMYCLAVGLFDEFNVYNTIWTEKLEAINDLKVINMPYGRWE